MLDAPSDGDERVDPSELLGDDAEPGDLFPEVSEQPPAVPYGTPAPVVMVEPDPGESPYRCLSCGYPLAVNKPRCSECGRRFTYASLDFWFTGDEEGRFRLVTRLALVSLFFRLLVVPELFWVSRLGTGVVALWACWRVLKGRSYGAAGYYALGGAIAAFLMFPTCAATSKLSFYTLDMLAGILLLIAMLRDPFGGSVGTYTTGQRVAPYLLVATPAFAVVCYGLDRVLSEGAFGAGIPVEYAPFGVCVPHLAAGMVWLLVWWTLRGVGRTIFTPVSDTTSVRGMNRGS